jgi:predicted glycoside hydrolase/deacetylase ChbG (UPF0249 family)
MSDVAACRFPRRLVLHADDFGMNEAVNNGILDAFSRGLLTSTSLLANAPAAEQGLGHWPALVDAHQNKALPSNEVRQRLADPSQPFDLGVHLNLTQGRPLIGARYPEELLDPAGRFPGIGPVFRKLYRPAEPLRPAIRAELTAQIEFLYDHGVRPTHLNGHQYVETIPAVAELIPGLLEEYAIPRVRCACEPHVARLVLFDGMAPLAYALAHVKGHFARQLRRRLNREELHPAAYFGASHAGRIDSRRMQRYLAAAPALGLTEVGLHPARAPVAIHPEHLDAGWHDPLAGMRKQELDCLCSSHLADLIADAGFALGRLG